MTPLWDHAVRTYSLPGMRGLLLELQDTHQMDVNAVLWILWLIAHDRTLTDDDVAEVLQETDEFALQVTQGLRRIRRYLSVPQTGFAPETLGPLRDQVLGIEIASEEITLKRLDALTADKAIALPPGSDGALAAERMFTLARESMDRRAVIADEGAPSAALHLFRQIVAIAQDQGS